jgi:hypothetical protein
LAITTRTTLAVCGALAIAVTVTVAITVALLACSRTVADNEGVCVVLVSRWAAADLAYAGRAERAEVVSDVPPQNTNIM